MTIDRAAIADARRHIASRQPGFLRTTPLMRVPGKALGVDCAEVWLKLEHLQVEAALRQGHAWPEIAQALGVTRQAVHKKHARRLAPDLRERNPR